MTEKEKQLLYSYILNNQSRLEQDVTQLQNNIRFRRIDTVDCAELICALQRLDTFNEVTNHVLLLLNLKKGFVEKFKCS